MRLIPFGWPVDFLAARSRLNHALAQKGGWVGKSGGHRLHRVGDKAVDDSQHSEPVFEWKLEGRVSLVDCEKTQQVDVERKRW